MHLLRDHCVHGRLDLEEFDARIGQAYAASTRGELDALLADLPAQGSSAGEHTAKLWWPGVASFHIERHLRAGCEAAFEDALRLVVPRMAMAGFHLDNEAAPRQLHFRSGHLRVGVLLHPASDGGTIIAAFGEAPRAIRKAFAALRD